MWVFSNIYSTKLPLIEQFFFFFNFDIHWILLARDCGENKLTSTFFEEFCGISKVVTLYQQNTFVYSWFTSWAEILESRTSSHALLPEVWIPDLLNKVDSNREWKLRPISLLIGQVMNYSTKKFQAPDPVIFLVASSLHLIINVTLAS